MNVYLEQDKRVYEVQGEGAMADMNRGIISNLDQKPDEQERYSLEKEPCLPDPFDPDIDCYKHIGKF